MGVLCVVKQKTAYGMRISDWSSDVCSSDLSSYGPTFQRVGLVETLKAAKAHPHYKAKLGKNQGRGVSCGFWFNFGGQTCVSLNVNIDGTVTLAVGTPDLGGSRASLTLMAAEELGIAYPPVHTVRPDTLHLGLP